MPSGGPGAVVIERGAMAFGQDGAGSTILLVHGAISDHGIWDAHAEMISARFRIIRPTLPYFGASPWPDKGEGYSTDAHAAALAQFIDALDLGPMDLVSAPAKRGPRQKPSSTE